MHEPHSLYPSYQICFRVIIDYSVRLFNSPIMVKLKTNPSYLSKRDLYSVFTLCSELRRLSGIKRANNPHNIDGVFGIGYWSTNQGLFNRTSYAVVVSW